MPGRPTQITKLLQRAADGDETVLDSLYDQVYDELRRLARSQRRRQGQAARSLKTTEVVHEAYIRLTGDRQRSFESRGHFFAVATMAMKALLVDQARRRLSQKRRGDEEGVTLDEDLSASTEREAESMLALNEALDQLGQEDVRLRQVVEYRFFGGMGEKEIGQALGVAPRTIRRDWVRARAWLQLHLGGEVSG